uniref:hypothetical protein n=1 Tax=Enterocloster clostridioformis TaxID=1531 RepID=UPI0026F17810|nr:hypothetical protein [Enterocloster clostridioformis]
MEDRLYYRELECYKDAPQELLRIIGKNDYYNLSALPTAAMRDEFRKYIRQRGSEVSLNTVQHDKAYFKQFCQALRSYRRVPKSLLDWDEKQWVQMLKSWMLQNGIALTDERKNVYGNLHRVEARLICYLRRVIRAVQPEDMRPEREKDIWKLDKLGIDNEENPIYKTDTINFTGILQDGIREEVKQAIYLHLKYEKLGTVKREMTSLRQFSKYLDAQQSRITSCKEIDRALLEEYLIHKATDGSSGRANSDDILKLRSVLESIGKIYGYPHLEKLFISTDIPSEI